MMPSQRMNPIFSLRPELTDVKSSTRQGIGWHFGSMSQGCDASTILVKRVSEAGECDIGPTTEGI